MSTSGGDAEVEARVAALRDSIVRARRRLDEVRRNRDTAVTARRRRAVPTSVHVLATAALIAAFALPGLVVAEGYGSVHERPCSTYARVKDMAVWAVASWAVIALAWAWLRRRRYRTNLQDLRAPRPE